MRDLAELLRGIGALLWPVAVIVALALFKDEFRELLRRLRRAKVLGQELDLDRDLDKLEARTEAIVVASSALSTAEDFSSDASSAFESDEPILRAATTSPRAALMLLSAELEREMRHLLATGGHLTGQLANLRQMSQELVRVAGLPRETLEAMTEFTRIRNRIVHGQPDVSDQEILRAIDIGLTLLRAVRSLPRERHVVAHPGAKVFSDASGTEERSDVWAVLLDVDRSDGSGTERRVYPTTLRKYRVGEQVSFDWNMDQTWGESWYRDPSSGELLYAWRTSAEFVGKPLESL
jgi:hypothetical protein